MSDSVAVLGATSQLAGDFARAVAMQGGPALTLYARDPDQLGLRVAELGISDVFPCRSLSTFGDEEHGAILNFIGIGDPARAQALGAGIFAATREWDDRVLRFCREAPGTRYVFLSSGAVYGDSFESPAGPDRRAVYPINNLGSANWYALAKLGAEAEHRSQPHLSIVDLRVFNYFSGSADPRARFLITDAARAIMAGEEMVTSRQTMTRDYLSPADLHGLVLACLAAPDGTNAPADAFSRAPIEKEALLDLLRERFGLKWRYADEVDVLNATGGKPFYYSTDRTAAAWGYRPAHASSDAITIGMKALLERCA